MVKSCGASLFLTNHFDIGVDFPLYRGVEPPPPTWGGEHLYLCVLQKTKSIYRRASVYFIAPIAFRLPKAARQSSRIGAEMFCLTEKANDTRKESIVPRSG